MKCPNCGKENPLEGQFCMQCGTRLVAPKHTSPMEEGGKGVGTWLSRMSAVAVGILVAILILIMGGSALCYYTCEQAF